MDPVVLLVSLIQAVYFFHCPDARCSTYKLLALCGLLHRTLPRAVLYGGRSCFNLSWGGVHAFYFRLSYALIRHILKMCGEILVQCISVNTTFLFRWFHSALSHASHLTNMSAFSSRGSAREILDSTSCVVHSYWTGRRVEHCPLLFRHQKHPLKTHKLLREHNFAYVFLGKCLPYVVFLSRLGNCWRTFSLLSTPFSCFERANSPNTGLNSHNSGSIHIVNRHAMLKYKTEDWLHSYMHNNLSRRPLVGRSLGQPRTMREGKH